MTGVIINGITTSVEEIKMDIEKVIDEVDIVLKKHGLGIDEYRLDDEDNMFLTIIPIILRKPQRKRYITL